MEIIFKIIKIILENCSECRTIIFGGVGVGGVGSGVGVGTGIINALKLISQFGDSNQSSTCCGGAGTSLQSKMQEIKEEKLEINLENNEKKILKNNSENQRIFTDNEEIRSFLEKDKKLGKRNRDQFLNSSSPLSHQFDENSFFPPNKKFKFTNLTQNQLNFYDFFTEIRKRIENKQFNESTRILETLFSIFTCLASTCPFQSEIKEFFQPFFNDEIILNYLNDPRVTIQISILDLLISLLHPKISSDSFKYKPILDKVIHLLIFKYKDPLPPLSLIRSVRKRAIRILSLFILRSDDLLENNDFKKTKFSSNAISLLHSELIELKYSSQPDFDRYLFLFFLIIPFFLLSPPKTLYYPGDC